MKRQSLIDTFSETKCFSQRLLIALLVLACVLCSLSAAAESSPSQPAGFQALYGAAYFEADGTYDLLTLNIGGQGSLLIQLDEEASNGISFDLRDEKGNPLADGRYAYELLGDSKRLSSGSFSIVGGELVSPEGTEDTLLTKDYQVNDDMSVVGNACIGWDCENDESYNNEVLKIKENNPVILFHDTSDSAEFPRRNWMIEANERANGGADAFKVIDCDDLISGCSSSNRPAPLTLEGGAPEHALFVDADGDLGLGTNVPQADVHMRSGNTPALRLDQDSSQFQPYTWDVAANESNFFVRDVTGSGKLPFRILKNAATNSLVIDSQGEVGLGKSNPSEKLDVNGNIAVNGTVDGRDVAADGAQLDAHVADSANPHQVTAAQVGAEPTGTAAAAIAAHEQAFHQGPSSTGPLSIAEGGTGATDAATARANLGIEDDPTQVGMVLATAFAGNPGSPATATVTFDTPYPAGTSYVVQLTAFSKNPAQSLIPNVIAKDENGFTLTAGGDLADLMAIDWIARVSPTVSAVAITSPADGFSIQTGQSFSVDYILLGASGVRAYVGGVAQLDHMGSGPITVTAPGTAGSQELRLEAIDSAGNELSASDAKQITVTAPPTSGISCEITVSDVWADGYVLQEVVVTNTGSESINTWAVTLQFSEPTALTNSWNATMSLSADGTVLDASSFTTNGTLAPGQSTTFGLQGTHDGSFELPTCNG